MRWAVLGLSCGRTLSSSSGTSSSTGAASEGLAVFFSTTTSALVSGSTTSSGFSLDSTLTSSLGSKSGRAFSAVLVFMTTLTASLAVLPSAMFSKILLNGESLVSVFPLASRTSVERCSVVMTGPDGLDETSVSCGLISSAIFVFVVGYLTKSLGLQVAIRNGIWSNELIDCADGLVVSLGLTGTEDDGVGLTRGGNPRAAFLDYKDALNALL